MKLSEICLIVDKPYYNTLQVYGHSEDASDGWGERRGHIYKEELKFLKFLRERVIYRDNSSYL